MMKWFWVINGSKTVAVWTVKCRRQVPQEHSCWFCVVSLIGPFKLDISPSCHCGSVFFNLCLLLGEIVSFYDVFAVPILKMALTFIHPYRPQVEEKIVFIFNQICLKTFYVKPKKNIYKYCHPWSSPIILIFVLGPLHRRGGYTSSEPSLPEACGLQSLFHFENRLYNWFLVLRIYKIMALRGSPVKAPSIFGSTISGEIAILQCWTLCRIIYLCWSSNNDMKFLQWSTKLQLFFRHVCGWRWGAS